MKKEIILTGIKPTGTAHIGNYFGAIKPAIEFANQSDAKCFFFIADYHALNAIKTKEELKKYTYEIAASWLACGLDPKKVVFYRQSDIPEVFELCSVLTNITPKGLMNRAHAYKAIVEENVKKGAEVDNNVNMGLYNYPILMAADILLFDTTKVPVGLDQKQHIEITRDIAMYFNKKYGEKLVIPEPLISEEVATIIGLDGRKMSKSYNNTIELFATDEQLKKIVSKIITDSTEPDEPKSIDNTIYHLYKLFADAKEVKEFEKELKQGISWADAKKKLYEKMTIVLTPLREKYDYYINNPDIVGEILSNGKEEASKIAKETIFRVKEAIGVTLY